MEREVSGPQIASLGIIAILAGSASIVISLFIPGLGMLIAAIGISLVALGTSLTTGAITLNRPTDSESTE